MFSFLDDNLHVKKPKFTWFSSQILLIKQSRNLIGWEAQLATPNQEIVSHATFLWWLSPCKKIMRLIHSFQSYWKSKNPSIQVDERLNWPQPTKSGSPRCLRSLIRCKDKLIPSRDMMIKEYSNLIDWEHFRAWLKTRFFLDWRFLE